MFYDSSFPLSLSAEVRGGGSPANPSLTSRPPVLSSRPPDPSHTPPAAHSHHTTTTTGPTHFANVWPPQLSGPPPPHHVVPTVCYRLPTAANTYHSPPTATSQSRPLQCPSCPDSPPVWNPSSDPHNSNHTHPAHQRSPRLLHPQRQCLCHGSLPAPPSASLPAGDRSSRSHRWIRPYHVPLQPPPGPRSCPDNREWLPARSDSEGIWERSCWELFYANFQTFDASSGVWRRAASHGQYG